jgi:hypothetical protein
MPIVENDYAKDVSEDGGTFVNFLTNVLFSTINGPCKSPVTLLGERDVREASCNGVE